jgi:SAM-dependent methyltransferase
LIVPHRPAFPCPLCGATARHRVLACRDHLVSGETFDVVECDACGLRMTEPQPDPETIGRYYESADYLPMRNDGAGPVAIAYRAVRHVTVRVRLGLVARHAPRPRGRLLDVGCGTGEFLAHARDAGWDVVGVEPAARAADDAERLGLAVRRSADLARLDEPPFDAITMWHALEHMHAPAAQLAQARRLLTPDGCVLVAVPSHDSIDARTYGAAWYAWDVPRHLWHFTPATLGRLLERQGFAPIAWHALPFDPFYIALLSELRGRGGWNVARAATTAVRSALAAGRDAARASAVVAVARTVEARS